MIFKALDFHVFTNKSATPSSAVHRDFRLRINHIIDSFSMRIPKRTQTESFHKLNITANSDSAAVERFFAIEGIGRAELPVHDIATIFQAFQPEAVTRVIDLLRCGIEVAARHDALFRTNARLWNELLSTSGERFDFELGIARSHRSRRWRARAVMSIGADAYHYDVLIQDSRTKDIVQRHRIKTTECLFPFYHGVGFSAIKWTDGAIEVLTKDGSLIARVETEMEA
jgi:hypothetical protein